jgi:hypothetical protein
MRLFAALALPALIVLVPVADAIASGADVVDDCTKHGTLTKHYSQKEYRQALADLPADVDEYGDCRNVIRQAQVAGATSRTSRSGNTNGVGPASFKTPPSGPSTSSTGGLSGGGSETKSSGGDDPSAIDPGDAKASNPETVDENGALIDATRNGGGAVKVGKDAIAPGAQDSSFVQSLPAPVIGVLALLGVAALTGGVLVLRRKLRSGD